MKVLPHYGSIVLPMFFFAVINAIRILDFMIYTYKTFHMNGEGFLLFQKKLERGNTRMISNYAD